jgi:hypothetical protein
VSDDLPGVESSLPINRLNTDVPQGARVWNVALGGKDNFRVDRDAYARIVEAVPEFGEIARESRAALYRVITFLGRDVEPGPRRITQFLDIGTGLPTANNTHEVAQMWDPASRIVYVDNDPLVLVHARALLTSTPAGRTAYIDNDVRNVDEIIEEAGETLDFTEPVALILFGILGHIKDTREATSTVKRLVAALPAGSFMAINDGTPAYDGEVARGGREELYWVRTPEQIEAFFDGLELLEPGVVSTPLWRPSHGTPKPLPVHCGLGRVTR